LPSTTSDATADQVIPEDVIPPGGPRPWENRGMSCSRLASGTFSCAKAVK
jgi:hypothetical protein